MEKIETNLDRGIVSPSHPPIIGVVALAASESTLKAGTVLKLSDKEYEPCDANDTPKAVLVQDVEKHDEAVNARVLMHGTVVESRLLGSDGNAAGETLKGKLSAAGIYMVQAEWDESNFN